MPNPPTVRVATQIQMSRLTQAVRRDPETVHLKQHLHEALLSLQAARADLERHREFAKNLRGHWLARWSPSIRATLKSLL